MINIRDKNYLAKFGKHLKSLREEQGLSQEELANRADVSLPQITRIERGVVNPTLCTLKAISKGLGIKLNGLFTFEN